MVQTIPETMDSSPPKAAPSLSTTLRGALHAYGAFLVPLSWGRFFLLATLLVLCTAVLENLPPFRWSFGEGDPIGDFLSDLALGFVVASAMLKNVYGGQMAAEKRAEKATEVAESEQIRRQMAEARLSSMQAQVEPHFLFNTLATIEHLIEMDPPRASKMQRSLIALLRATMPTLRDGSPHNATRTLGQELEVVLPYLDIMKMRMEERLTTRIEVADGLRSAACPPMALQLLVENAVRHGLEPKPEGGLLSVSSHVMDGQLVADVEDTGVGVRHAPKSTGSGTGIAGLRERLTLLYGKEAALVLEERPQGGTRARLMLPYQVKSLRSEGDPATTKDPSP